jgi:hypothetical protein
MRVPTRITISLDSETMSLLEKLRRDMKLSQSGVFRRALRFYSENKKIVDEFGSERIKIYVDMLSSGEHIILDVDHFLLFLKFIESSPDKEKFWEDHLKVAKSHSEQFSSQVPTAEGVLKRLEACNFFKLNKASENEFTLILFSDLTKRFVKTFLEVVLPSMGYKVEIKEDFAKLRVKAIK